MISIVIPLPNSDFFAYACRQNIQETIGLPTTEYEIIFLTADEKPYKGIHLSLLNRHFANSNENWIYVQHADMFWLDYGWGIDLLKCKNKVAWMVPHGLCKNEFNCVEHKFVVKSKLITRTHDFAGFYDRNWFMQNQMNFNWGKLKVDLAISPELENKIIHEEIHWIHRNTPVKIGDFVDGSDLIGLEIAVHNPDLIGIIPTTARYIHCWDLFSISHDFEIKGNTIFIERLEEKCVRSLHTYSWISSHLMPKTEKIFPWRAIQEIAKFPEHKIQTHKSPLCFLLEKYKKIQENHDIDVKKVQFKDKSYILP